MKNEKEQFEKPYEGWCPYCLVCSEIKRMLQKHYGYKCCGCKNQIDFNLERRKV